MAVPSALSNPGAYLRRQGIVRGLLGGHRGWLVLSGLAWGFRLLRWAASTRRLRPVLTEELLPGEGIVITHFTNEQQ